MLITPVPDIQMKNHARKRNHHVQMVEIGTGKKAHCLDCGARWFNVTAACEAAVNDTLDNPTDGPIYLHGI